MITWRRICWPNPDATCLHGGCIYCNHYPYRKISTIRRWVETAGILPHRGQGTEDALAAFMVGLKNDFFNADTK